MEKLINQTSSDQAGKDASFKSLKPHHIRDEIGLTYPYYQIRINMIHHHDLVVLEVNTPRLLFVHTPKISKAPRIEFKLRFLEEYKAKTFLLIRP